MDKLRINLNSKNIFKSKKFARVKLEQIIIEILLFEENCENIFLPIIFQITYFLQ